jgi:hypothetical protein
MKRFLLQQARSCGPSVSRLIQTVWADGVLDMFRDSRELIELAYRYSSRRLQAACRRAIYYRKDRNYSIVSHILEHQYDQLPLSPYTDIRGQFLFSFDPYAADGLNNLESRIPPERTAV